MAQPTEPKTVTVYQDGNGKEPFTDWLNGLRDQKGRRAILKRIGRLELGLYGDNIVVLLLGGDKGSQDRDIKTAKEFWKEYKDHG